MAASPPYKVYNPQGDYIASCKHAEDAACLAGLNGNGSKIKYERAFILWTEGSEEIPAGESYDRAAKIMHARLEAQQRTSYGKAYESVPI